MKYATLILDNATEGVVWVQLHRPERRNALDAQMMTELSSLFSELSQNNEVQLVLLSGSGNVFCSGADLGWMGGASELSAEDRVKDSHMLSSMLEIMDELPQPLVALVHGAAKGGALGILGCCDEVLATPDTLFALPEVRIGLIPAMISPYLVPKIGFSSVLSLCLSGRNVRAEEALRIGLINRIDTEVPSVYSVNALAQEYLCAGQYAQRAAKKFIKEQYRKNKGEAFSEFCSTLIAELRSGEEAKEGIRSFFEKRSPRWSKKI